METPEGSMSQFDQSLERLQQIQSLSPDEAFGLANQATEIGNKMALELESAGQLAEAARLYDRIAQAWQQAVTQLADDQRPYFLSIVTYWFERASTARQNAENAAGSTVTPPPAPSPARQERPSQAHQTIIKSVTGIPAQPSQSMSIMKETGKPAPSKEASASNIYRPTKK
jgi:hypothetical protein